MFIACKEVDVVICLHPCCAFIGGEHLQTFGLTVFHLTCPYCVLVLLAVHLLYHQAVCAWHEFHAGQIEVAAFTIISLNRNPLRGRFAKFQCGDGALVAHRTEDVYDTNVYSRVLSACLWIREMLYGRVERIDIVDDVKSACSACV